MSAAEAIVAAARGCVGVRFRPQGRDRATGLDCLGVVLIALDAVGCVPDAPGDYCLSGTGLVDRAEAGLRATRLGQVPSSRPGDIILFEPADGQAHLAVATSAGVVHAHRGVGRAVESPPDPAWLRRSVWRFAETV